MTKSFNIGFMQGRMVKPENKKYIQFFPAKNWSKEFNLASKNKFKNIELTANISNIKKNPVFNPNMHKQFLRRLDKNKIKTDSLTCDFFMEKPFFKLKKKKEELKSKELLRKVIKVSQKINIKKFIIPLVDNSSVKNKKEELKLIKYFNSYEFQKNLKKNTIILFESDYNPKKLLKFIKKFKPSKFGINYDSGNSASLNYRIEEEKIYFDYVKNIHIKDRLIYGKTVDLGKGNAQIKTLIDFIKQTRYSGNLILQTAMPKKNFVQKLLQNRKFLEKYL